MNIKTLLIIITLLIVAVGGGLFWFFNLNISDEVRAQRVVQKFAEHMSDVPLAGNTAVIAEAMDESYKDVVSPELLEYWKNAPAAALGRSASSPWPDKIEITSTARVDENTYEVRGDVLEITSQEALNGGVASRYPVTFIVKKEGNRWLIRDAYRR